jgi:hypothetical protein
MAFLKSMREEIRKRIDALLDTRNVTGYEAYSGALSLMVLVYGAGSPQVRDLTQKGESFATRFYGAGLEDNLSSVATGALQNLKAEIDGGLIVALQKTITGDVLADFLQLGRAALDEAGDDAKNVAAVLAAALFEDTLRRLALVNGIPHIEKLQDTLTALKDNSVMQGSQVGIANSYLNFRNSALHAQWDRVERESIASVLGFVEQLLLKHFG